MNAEFFTAKEIAEALGKTRFAIRRSLTACPPAGVKIASGNRAPTWTLDALPEDILAELTSVRRAKGYKAVIDVLREPPRRWEPTVALAEVAPTEIVVAERLQRALARALALPAESSMEARAELAVTDYRREFGHVVGGRHLRRLIQRTLDRDSGAGGFGRLEIYLPDAPRQHSATSSKRRNDYQFPEVDDALQDIHDRTTPTPADRNHLFRAACQAIDRLRDADADETKAKTALRAYLWKVAPFLARSPGALKRSFNLKLAAHNKGDAIVDGRERSGRRRKAPEWEHNFTLLKSWTLRYSGRESQAWRELYDGSGPSGERFTTAFRDYYAYDVRNAKSRVPTALRAELRPIVEAAMPQIHGPHAARLALPSARRDWSRVHASDSYTSDDVTQNHYFYDWCDEGEFEFSGSRFNVTRGQLLPVMDERTDYPLGFSLIPRKSYNGRDIRTLICRVCMDEGIGLPFVRFLFELGIWKSRNVEALGEWTRITEAFSKAEPPVTLRMHHAHGSKSKGVIESAIGRLQSRMQHAPGYAGRDERHDRYERVNNFVARLKRVGQPIKAELDPAEMLPSKDQITAEIEAALYRFAAEPQNGERLPGISPAEGWQMFSPPRPHAVLPESLRYLLATEESTQRVTTDGVFIKIAGERCQYLGPQLGELIGERVRVRFNPELPEQVMVCHLRADPQEQNPFAVPLRARLPAIGATREELAADARLRREFSRFGTTNYRILRPPTNLTLRNDNLGTAELRATGEALNMLEGKALAVRGDRARHSREIVELSTQHNLRLDPAAVKNPARVAEHLSRAAELEREALRLEAEADLNP